METEKYFGFFGKTKKIGNCDDNEEETIVAEPVIETSEQKTSEPSDKKRKNHPSGAIRNMASAGSP